MDSGWRSSLNYRQTCWFLHDARVRIVYPASGFAAFANGWPDPRTACCVIVADDCFDVDAPAGAPAPSPPKHVRASPMRRLPRQDKNGPAGSDVARRLLFSVENSHGCQTYGTMSVYLHLEGIVPASTERAQQRRTQ